MKEDELFRAYGVPYRPVPAGQRPYVPPVDIITEGVLAGQGQHPLERMFWAQTALVNGPRAREIGPCREWTGRRSRDGYGILVIGRKHHLAHRVAFEIQKGPIPDGLMICHHCDNPPCLEGVHLWPGTQRENFEDMRRKGRHLGTLAQRESRLPVREQEFRARRRDAIARSIPHEIDDYPQPFHKVVDRGARALSTEEAVAVTPSLESYDE